MVSGVGQLLDVTIDPSVIDPADPAETAATIADLVLAAVRDAWDSAVDLQQRQLGALGGGLGGGFGGPPAGFDLSSLGLPSFGGQLGLDGTTKTTTTTRTTRTTTTTRTSTKTTTTKTDGEVPKTARTNAADVRRRHPAPHR